MKPTIKIRFTEPQVALVMRAHHNSNLDYLTELSFEFDQAGEIVDCVGKIRDGGNIGHDYTGGGLARLVNRHAPRDDDSPAELNAALKKLKIEFEVQTGAHIFSAHFAEL